MVCDADGYGFAIRRLSGYRLCRYALFFGLSASLRSPIRPLACAISLRYARSIRTGFPLCYDAKVSPAGGEQAQAHVQEEKISAVGFIDISP